jgi:peptidoglycan/xylan/chitin deacetylase (PgdA/CDA1 family)
VAFILWFALIVGAASATVAMQRLSNRPAALMLVLIVPAGLGIWLVLSGRAALLLVVAAAGALAASRLASARPLSRPRAGAAACLGVLPGLVCFAYLGATLPQATWFGDAVSHGPRSGNAVALTFDDGPNGEWTLDVMRVLDDAGVKGTFFEVGKAVAAEPDVAQMLVAHGHVIGDHSYSHGRWDWLVPGYPEAAKAQTAIQTGAGVCPAFFRPPHGDRTPLTVRTVSKQGLTTVTWDVSAADWATTDPALVARRVLEQVKPGSIILLHDGLDGQPGADRSVVAEALPAILDGLEARGLTPVRLDQLLGLPAYGDSC